jgi:lipoprotein-anchoring transpeptidase ErfK/SrfK
MLSMLGAGLALLVALATGPAAAAAPASRPFIVQPTQALAVLLGAQRAMSGADGRSVALQLVDARRPLTGARTVLPVIGRRSSSNGIGWLHVLLPGRPNGQTGWIRSRGAEAARTNWHIVVDTSKRRVTVYERGRQVQVFRAVVGKPATPTPHGTFFVEEVVRLWTAEAGAPFALALSARSTVLHEFAGGPGQIALHGLRNVGGRLGSAVSHGCIRLDTEAMRWLASRIGPGVPVTITR